jgi:hypothetical protein
VRTIDRLLNSLARDASVEQALIGSFWTIVQVTGSGSSGLSSTVRGEHHHAGPPIPEAGQLVDYRARELAEWLRSPSALKASVGMAAFNALLDVDAAACTAVNARDVILERGAGRRVAVVGHFPFVERVRQAAETCWVLELNPRPGDIPAERADEILPQADVVALTGTSLINHTFDALMALCRPEAFVLVLGPSTPLTPVMFDAGADAISGTLVVEPQAVFRALTQGATFRQIKRTGGLRLLTMFKQ